MLQSFFLFYNTSTIFHSLLSYSHQHTHIVLFLSPYKKYFLHQLLPHFFASLFSKLQKSCILTALVPLLPPFLIPSVIKHFSLWLLLRSPMTSTLLNPMINSSCHTRCGSQLPWCPRPPGIHTLCNLLHLAPCLVCVSKSIQRWRYDIPKLGCKRLWLPSSMLSCLISLSFSLGSLALRDAAAMSWGHSDSLQKSPHGEEMGCLANNQWGTEDC